MFFRRYWRESVRVSRKESAKRVLSSERLSEKRKEWKNAEITDF